MKRSLPSTRAAEVENLRDGLQLALESVTWLCAWIALPVWLAWRDSGIDQLLAYSLGSGGLLALGVLADRGGASEGAGHLLWLGSITCLAILLAGGTAFGLTHLLLWAMA